MTRKRSEKRSEDHHVVSNSLEGTRDIILNLTSQVLQIGNKKRKVKKPDGAKGGADLINSSNNVGKEFIDIRLPDFT